MGSRIIIIICWETGNQTLDNQNHSPPASGETGQASKPVLDDISVVIPTLGREILEQSLACIAQGSGWPRELIVVDQGRVDRVASWLTHLRERGMAAVYVPSKQSGRAAGVNRGLERLTTRFFAVTDDDCFVGEDWLILMAEKLRANPEAIVTGRVEPGGKEVLAVATSRVPAFYTRPRLNFDSMSGGNMGASREVLKRVGPYDEDPRIRTAEDGEWAYRALKAGVPICYDPEICVVHHGWRPVGDRWLQYKDYARSHGGFYGKYLRKMDGFIALRVVVHLLRALRRTLRGTLTGDHELSMNGRAYLAGLLPGILAGLRADPDP